MDTIKQKAKIRIKYIVNHLVQEKYGVSSIKENDFNFSTNISQGKNEIKLLVYFGKKGVKPVLQGNSDTELYNKVYDIIFGESLFAFEKNKIDEPEEYIGTDESGKGDYFGPLVVAGVLVDKKISSELRRIGVKDSKELTDNIINSLADRIKNIVKNKADVIVINPRKYNELYNKIGNLNRLLAWAHAKVLENILEKHSVNEAISDKFGDEKLIISSLQQKGQQIVLHQYTKAERFTAVAAASIMARAKFNSWFTQSEDNYRMKFLKGASKKVEDTAKAFIKKYGNDELPNVAKLHFKTTKKIQ